MLRWFRTTRNFHLGSKSLAALLPVEPWSSAVGARGELQQAWFRVSGIPIDQRNVRTIARVGGQDSNKNMSELRPRAGMWSWFQILLKSL